MLRYLFMWALLCTTALFVCSQEISTPDSIDNSIPSHSLEELTVKASPGVNTTDGKVIRPTSDMLLTATDGIDLLRKLQLFRITIGTK